MKIYTKTGDSGTSALYNGQRRSKDDLAFNALGDIDELNSSIGLARDLTRTYLPNKIPQLLSQLEVIQSRLLDCGSAVATPKETSSQKKLDRTTFDKTAISSLEEWIDDMSAVLPPLANFILPSGGVPSSSLHLARCTCRRAERSVVPLTRGGQVDPIIGIYLNRLSDYLFTAARMASFVAGEKEIVYKK